MSTSQSPTGVNIKHYAYEDFMGLDTSRPSVAMDTGEEQHFIEMSNAFCDWRGQIVRDPDAVYISGGYPIHHVVFFSKDKVVWAEETGRGVTFRSENNHALEHVHEKGVIISSTVFNRKVMLATRSRPMYSYDGDIFTRITSPSLELIRPAFVISIQRRLIVAGGVGKETEIHASRVDNEYVFPEDEDESSTSVLKASYFDVANLIGTADEITGLGAFESNRLVIFTADKAIIYKIDPDYTKWLVDDNANINIGCVSHNTIQNAGTDVLFCSRSGVHSIKRSEDNGILVYSYSLSDKVKALYREYLSSVTNPEAISAVFNQDTSQYHIYFPLGASTTCRRLTLTMNAELEESVPKYNTGSFLDARCAASLGGRLALGTAGGLYNEVPIEQTIENSVTPSPLVTTPLLWHGSLTDIKETHSIILQASGVGTVHIEAQNERGDVIGTLKIEIDDTTDDNYFNDVPLSQQYERKWQHRYRAAQYRFKIVGGSGLLRITGFAITVRK
jgi:hypothetical protein